MEGQATRFRSAVDRFTGAVPAPECRVRFLSLEESYTVADETRSVFASPTLFEFLFFFFPADRLVLNEVILDVAFHHDRITR